MGSGDPGKRNNGVTSLVVSGAIQFMPTATHAFDFAGSMTGSAEHFDRSFAGRPCPCFVISKVNSPLWFVYCAVRDRWDGAHRKRE